VNPWPLWAVCSLGGIIYAVRFPAFLLQRLPSWLSRRLLALRASRFNFELKRATLRRYGVSFARHPLRATKYLLVDPEVDNFTYEIANEDELIDFVAMGVGRPRAVIEGYVQEVRTDPELNGMLRRQLRRRLDRKHKPHFGRRLGWYAIARALKPAVIVETGIHDGLGSVLLLRALHTNALEGKEGRLLSFDVNPKAGWLVDERVDVRWHPVFESTFLALEDALKGLEVGMIVHDSEHTYECEHFELMTAVSRAAPTLALVSDNAHATSSLRDVCGALGIQYRFFQERPRRHFYPGAGIGLGLLQQELLAALAESIKTEPESIKTERESIETERVPR
jgi:hypothetical protein